MKSNGVPKIEYSGKEPSSTRPNYKKKDRIVDPGFPVDPMGYWNPANVGKIVQVPTENGHITMRGVDQPLIGMDEHGNTQYQIPGQEYHYQGKFITEYPITKNGGWLDIAQDGKEVKLKNIKQLYNPLNERYTKLLEDPEAYKKNGEKNLLFLADWLMRVNDTEDLTERNPHPYTQQIKDMQLKLISTPNDELSNFIQNADLNQKGLGQLKNLPYIPKSWNKSDVFKYMNYFKQNKDKGYTYQDGGWLDTMQDGGSLDKYQSKGEVKKDKRKIPQSGMVIDKRTNQAYYFGDKGETGSFPVLTGLNPELNSNTYSAQTLNQNPQLKNTPVGYYMLEQGLPKTPYTNTYYNGRIRPMQPIPAFGMNAPDSEDLSMHNTFSDPSNPSIFNTRNKMYSAPGDKRYVSQGCINCQKESYDAFNKAIPHDDTLMVLDSKNPKDLALLQQAQARMKKKQDGGSQDNTNVVINNGFPIKSIEAIKAEKLKEEAQKNYVKSGAYYKDLRKELDSIQAEIPKLGLNPFQFYKMQQRAGEIFKILGEKKPELVKKEIGTGQKAGKTLIAAGKYIFPGSAPIFNGIEGAMAGYEFAQDPNIHNTASLMTEIAPHINSKYGTAYQLMGDYLTGQEVGLLPEDEKKKGGSVKGLSKFTSKNIATSVNDIMMRNVTLFGPAGKKRYKPGLKFKNGGGWLDNIV